MSIQSDERKVMRACNLLSSHLLDVMGAGEHSGFQDAEESCAMRARIMEVHHEFLNINRSLAL